eukprot:567070-Rhodomonas_salina.2
MIDVLFLAAFGSGSADERTPGPERRRSPRLRLGQRDPGTFAQPDADPARPELQGPAAENDAHPPGRVLLGVHGQACARGQVSALRNSQKQV